MQWWGCYLLIIKAVGENAIFEISVTTLIFYENTHHFYYFYCDKFTGASNIIAVCFLHERNSKFQLGVGKNQGVIFCPAEDTPLSLKLYLQTLHIKDPEVVYTCSITKCWEGMGTRCPGIGAGGGFLEPGSHGDKTSVPVQGSLRANSCMGSSY